MKRLVPFLVPAAALAGCFSTSQPAPRSLGEPVATTRVTSALTGAVADVAVDPGSGDVVLLSGEPETYDTYGMPLATGKSTLSLIERGSGRVLGEVLTDIHTDHLGATAPGRVMVSDGVEKHFEVDLVAGTATAFTGLLEAADHAPYTLDADGGEVLMAGGDGEVVAIESWPCPPSEIGFWTGKGADRRLTRSAPLPLSIGSVSDIAYAQDRGALFLVTNRGLVALDATTGDKVAEYDDTSTWFDGPHIAYDPVTQRLLVATGKAELGGLRIDEYQL